MPLFPCPVPDFIKGRVGHDVAVAVDIFCPLAGGRAFLLPLGRHIRSARAANVMPGIPTAASLTAHSRLVLTDQTFAQKVKGFATMPDDGCPPPARSTCTSTAASEGASRPVCVAAPQALKETKIFSLSAVPNGNKPCVLAAEVPTIYGTPASAKNTAV